MSSSGRSSSASRSRPSAVPPQPSTAKPRSTSSSNSTSRLLFLLPVLTLGLFAGAFVVYVGPSNALELVSTFATQFLKDCTVHWPWVGLSALTTIFALISLQLWARNRGGVFAAIQDLVLSGLTSIPGVQGAVDAEIGKIVQDLESDLMGAISDDERIHSMPEKGMSADDVLDYLEFCADRDRSHWTSGKLSGTIYHGGDELNEIIASAMSKFALSNPLHPDSFPSVRKMDAEIVSMTLSLFHPTKSCCGTTTSGGTESILLAIKAYRDRGRSVKGITEPEMIVPISAHAAFDKGAQYFGIHIIKLPVDDVTFRVNPADVKAAVTKNTVMIVGSAPNFPQGTVDPIPELASIASEADCGLHVDCCLGSYMIPFARSIGKRDIPSFDFAVDGVTSISCDTHKFGFAPKGSSVLMWRSSEWRTFQYYSCTDWTGGIYATPTVSGSRAGANLAATWAVLRFHGREGYEDAARKIFAAADVITEGIRSIPGIEQYGVTDHAIIAFGPRRDGSPSPNIYKVATAMSQRGWSLNPLQKPACIHICVTYANAPLAHQFLTDLAESVDAVMANPDAFKGGAAAMYGSTTAMAPAHLIHQVARLYLDTMYKA